LVLSPFPIPPRGQREPAPTADSLVYILTLEEPRSEVARVRCLLGAVLSPYFHWGTVGEAGVVDVRRPVASQLDKFAALGYATVPTAGQVMKCIVSYSEAEAADLRAELEAAHLNEERVRIDEEVFMGGTRCCIRGTR
jgi:hypothetical protein